MGYVPSMRRGNTGIGYTLETMLGARENNLRAPDFGDMELKAHRRGAASRITLFTFNRGARKTPQANAIRKYGYIDTNGRHSLYCLASPRPTIKAFTLGSGTMAFPFAMRMAHSSPNGAGRRLLSGSATKCPRWFSFKRMSVKTPPAGKSFGSTKRSFFPTPT